MKPSLHLTCIQLLEDIKAYLEQIKSADYRASLELLFGTSVGQHTRHILDGYSCLFEQVDQVPCVNYELRKRDERLESDTHIALNFIDSLIDKLSAVGEDDQALSLVVNYNTKEDVSHFVNSTFQRELTHNIEHTIHHMAIIKIAVKHHFKYVNLSKDFGIAPSTIRFRNALNDQVNYQMTDVTHHR